MSLRDLCDVAYVLQLDRTVTSVTTHGDADALDAVQEAFDADLLANLPRQRPTPAGTDRLSQMKSLLTDLGV